MLMRFNLIAGALLGLSLVLSTAPASAWSEQNCQNSCKNRMPDNVSGCYARFNCAQYRGKPSVAADQESAALDAWIKKKNQQK
jgi:hypothetical protein